MSGDSAGSDRRERQTTGHAIDPRNQGRINAGETFRSQKPSTWQPGKSPSSYSNRGNRHR